MRRGSCAGVLALAALACATPERSQQANIALIVMDTVRADHLSAYGYERGTSPFLERLCEQGTRFDRAWSSSSWTLPAHASMFTGLLPRDHGASQSHLSLVGQPVQLAQLLARGGYHTAGFSNNPWVSDKTGLAAGFDHYGELWRKRQRPDPLLGDPTSAAVASWLEQDWDRERPFFLFVNLMEAHGPYEPDWKHSWPLLGGPLQVGQARERYQSVDELGLVRSWYAGGQPLDAGVIEGARDLYDAEIRQVDAAVERIVAHVDRHADPADTTLVVTTDHGESFGDHGHVGHAFSVYDNLLRVAMVARGPGFARGVSEPGVVQLVDLFPTLLMSAGVVPPHQGGIDMRGELPQERGLAASYAYPDQVLGTFPAALRRSAGLDAHRRSFAVGLDGRHKLIIDSEGREELYDLSQDPGELSPLQDAPADLLERLRALAESGRPVEHVGPAVEVDREDQETVQALRALGYLGE